MLLQYPCNLRSCSSSSCTRAQVLDLLQNHEAVGKRLSAPSISYGSENLYARGIFEADTRHNLSKVRETLE